MISYLKVNNIDVQSSVKAFSAKLGMFESTMDIALTTRMGVGLTWVEGQTVTWKTDDSVIMFHGVISSIKRTITANATYEWSITCKDTRLEYQKYTVNFKMPSTYTVSQALNALITNYTVDTIGTDETNKLTLCPLSFNGEKLPEAIKSCLDMLEIPCYWEIVYNDGTGVITHNFKKQFFTNVGELDYVDPNTGDYTVNTDEIFNHVEIFSDTIVWPNPDIQFYDYAQYLEPWDKKPNRVKLPLKRPAKGLMAYLLVGTQTTSIADFMEASRIPWTNINGVDNADGALIGFDVKTTGSFVVPSYSMSSSGNIKSTVYGAEESIAFTGAVNTKVLELLQPDSALYLQSASQGEAPHGYLYLPTLAWLKDKVDIISKYAGTVIPPENILGWAIQMIVEQPKTVSLDEATSQATYGVKPAPLEQLKTKSIMILELYARYRLAYLSDARETGQCTCEMWTGSTQRNAFYPKPGLLVDLNHPIRPDKTDLCCQQVTYEYNAQEQTLMATVDSSKRGKNYLAGILAAKIKAAVDHQSKPTDEEITSSITVESDVTITCETDIVTNSTVGFDGMLRRIYYG